MKRGVPFLRFSTVVVVAIFVVLLLMLVDHLDSIASSKPHFEPNNFVDSRNTTISSSIDRRNRQNSHATIFDRDIFREIPYIRYNESLSIETVKERMDFAASHGDADNPNNPNNTIGQHLLDFGIIGFPKCGTTTMMKWLNMHDQMAVLNNEIMALQKHHPARILRFVVNNLPEGQYRRGYKSPNDVSDGRARNKLRIHYPETKLLVGLRHPVLWFESFYNHRIQNGMQMPNLAEELSKDNAERKVKEYCSGVWHGACFPRANFHSSLVKWGKTPLLSVGNSNKDYDSYYAADYKRDDEWKLFSKKDRRKLEDEINRTEISPNPIFLYDVSQLHISHGNNKVGKDEEKKQQQYGDFVLSLQEFLGVPKNVSAMPPMIRESPGRTEGINATEQERIQSLKINICDEKYALARKWLLDIGANVDDWITFYLAKSPHGVYFGGGKTSDGSFRLLEIIHSYGKDPCEERRLRKERK